MRVSGRGSGVCTETPAFRSVDREPVERVHRVGQAQARLVVLRRDRRRLDDLPGARVLPLERRFHRLGAEHGQARHSLCSEQMLRPDGTVFAKGLVRHPSSRVAEWAGRHGRPFTLLLGGPAGGMACRATGPGSETR